MSLNDFVRDVVKETEKIAEYEELKDALKKLEPEQEEEVYMVTFSSQ